MFSAVLGVHNLLNNPKFDEETTNGKGHKGPVRSKLMRNLGTLGASAPLSGAYRRESLGSEQSNPVKLMVDTRPDSVARATEHTFHGRQVVQDGGKEYQ